MTAVIEDRRQPRAERKRDNARAVGGNESIDHDVKCVRLGVERRERGSDILSSPDFERCDFDAERASRCRNLAHLQRGGGIADIGYDRQAAETGDDFT